MPARIRVATSGTTALSEDFGNSAPSVGKVLVSKGAGLPPDWDTIGAPLNSYYAANWTQAVWYLDKVLGNDGNSGDNPARALKTGAELARRLGPYAIWPQSVTIHVMQNGLDDPLVVQGVLTTPQTFVDVVGYTLVTASGTVATYSGIDHATPKAPQLTAGAIANWTPYIGQQLYLSSGASATAISWVATANPNGAGMATARTPRWAVTNQTSLYATYSVVAPTPGDGFSVRTLPYVPAVVIKVDAGPGTKGTPDLLKRAFSVQHIHTPFLHLDSVRIGANPCGIVFGCLLSTVSYGAGVTADRLLTPQVSCQYYLDDNTPSGANGIYPTGTMVNPLFGNFVLAADYMSVNLIWGGQTNIINGLAQGATFLLGGGYVHMSDMQSFDVDDNAFLVADNTSASILNLSGSQISLVGLAMGNNCTLTLGTTTNIVGTNGACQMLRPTPYVFSWAQITTSKPNFAASGVATIGATGAGYVTVAVPWWDPTTQSITVTRRDPAGTIGDLSTPAAQFTNTSFRIASANVLDTSTVSWSISPFGRGNSIVLH